MKHHVRFETLAGAIALGEATEEEQAEWAAHAAVCVRCRDHGAGELIAVRNRIVAEREAETWRPSLRSGLMTRIRDERLRRSRVTLRVLCWSVAVSIALDAGFVSGVSSYAAGAFHFTSASLANVAASYRTALR